jgi:hypothetical protein
MNGDHLDIHASVDLPDLKKLIVVLKNTKHSGDDAARREGRSI